MSHNLSDLHGLVEALSYYENKWVALADDTVVASGDSVKEVKRKIEEKGFTEYTFYLVPSSSYSFAPTNR
jgi:hypothetical protein